MALESDLIALDEPTAGLDEANITQLVVAMDHASEHGRAVVLVSHDLDFCAAHTDRVVLIQAGVVAIDARRRDVGGGWEVFTHGGRRGTGIDAIAWAKQVEALGAGEILLTSMDRDGTKQGFDLELTAAVRAATRLPIVASGGVGELSHFVEGARAGATGLLAASVFHYGVFRIAEAKAALAAAGLPIRPVPHRQEAA
jgi:cyclase